MLNGLQIPSRVLQKLPRKGCYNITLGTDRAIHQEICPSLTIGGKQGQCLAQWWIIGTLLATIHTTTSRHRASWPKLDPTTIICPPTRQRLKVTMTKHFGAWLRYQPRRIDIQIHLRASHSGSHSHRQFSTHKQFGGTIRRAMAV